MIRERRDLNGFVLETDCATEEIARAIGGALFPFPPVDSTPDEAAAMRLAIFAAPNPGGDPPLPSASSENRGEPTIFTRDGETRIIRGADFRIEFDTRRRTGSLTVTDAASPMLSIGVILALGLGFQSRGGAVLHSAGLALPPGAGPGAVLLHAPSGTGKTTSTLALIGAGFRAMSDDVVFLPQGERVTAWGFPRNLKIHKRTKALLPWIPLDPTTDWDEWNEAPLRFERLVDAGAASFETLPVVATFHLARDVAAPPARSRWTRLGSRDAALALITDNIGRDEWGVSEVELAQFKFLCRLTERVPAFRLDLGPDPDELGDVILSALRDGTDRSTRASPANDAERPLSGGRHE